MNFTIAVTAAEAFTFTAFLVPAVKALCERWNIFDAPGPLKIHSKPIPRLGGVAIAFAMALAVVSSSRSLADSARPFFAGLALVWIAGLIDDVRSLSPIFRIGAQIAAAAVLWRGGWHLPGFPAGFLGLGALCFFVVFFANAFNLLDGSDGLASGVACMIAAAYVVLPGVSHDLFLRVVASTLAGASAAFIFYNFSPAVIFLGDSGSTILGFTIAFLALEPTRSNSSNGSPLTFVVLASALPLLDAVLAVARRMRRGASAFYGDRFHFYDLLLQRSYSARNVALASYSITAALAVVGWICEWNRLSASWEVLAVTLGVLTTLGIRLGSLRGDDRARANAPVRSAERKAGKPVLTD